MVELSKKELRAWVRLDKAHRRLTAVLQSALSQAGLPPLGWYALLKELSRGPAGGMRPFELEEATGEAQYNVSRLLDRMVKDGVVARSYCEDDRRGALVALSPKGAETLARMRDVYEATLSRELVDRLSGKEVKALDGLLGELLPERKRGPA